MLSAYYSITRMWLPWDYKEFGLLKSFIKIQRHLGRLKPYILDKNLQSLRAEKMTQMPFLVYEVLTCPGCPKGEGILCNQGAQLAEHSPLVSLC